MQLTCGPPYGFGAKLCPVPACGTSCFLAASEVLVTGWTFEVGLKLTGAGPTGVTCGFHVLPPLEAGQ